MKGRKAKQKRKKPRTEGRSTRPRYRKKMEKARKKAKDLGHRVTCLCFMHISSFKTRTTFLGHQFTTTVLTS